jgi:hypothetical protein
VIDVNLIGVLCNAFLPHIRVHGEGGHMTSTAPLGYPSQHRFAMLRAA